MHDNVQWLIRSSQKDIESTAFAHLATKIGEEPSSTRFASSSESRIILEFDSSNLSLLASSGSKMTIGLRSNMDSLTLILGLGVSSISVSPQSL